MMNNNYVCAYSQSETKKYFEWIINAFNASLKYECIHLYVLMDAYVGLSLSTYLSAPNLNSFCLNGIKLLFYSTSLQVDMKSNMQCSFTSDDISPFSWKRFFTKWQGGEHLILLIVFSIFHLLLNVLIQSLVCESVFASWSFIFWADQITFFSV